MTYPELDGERPSAVAWEVAAARSRERSARRRAEHASARNVHALAAVYGVIFAGAVILADLGGLPGIL
jgi:hypothetical protein